MEGVDIPMGPYDKGAKERQPDGPQLQAFGKAFSTDAHHQKDQYRRQVLQHRGGSRIGCLDSHKIRILAEGDAKNSKGQKMECVLFFSEYIKILPSVQLKSCQDQKDACKEKAHGHQPRCLYRLLLK